MILHVTSTNGNIVMYIESVSSLFKIKIKIRKKCIIQLLIIVSPTVNRPKYANTVGGFCLMPISQ